MHMQLYRKCKEHEKRVAKKVAKQHEEAEMRWNAQGHSVHEEQLEELSQKEKEKEESNRNNKEVGERISVRDILSDYDWLCTLSQALCLSCNTTNS